jgi:hypothetical protein
MIDPQLGIDETTAASERTLRQFAALWILVFGGLAARWWYGGATPRNVILLLAAALLVGIPGLLRPALIRPVFEGAIVLTRPIGAVISYLLLVLLYFGLFTPFALFFRTIGRDALERRRPASRTSYWSAKPRAPDVRSYFRQS